MPHPNLTIGFFLCAVLCSKVLLSSWHESWALFFTPHLVFDVVVVCNHKMLSSSIQYLHTLDNSFKLNMGCAECGCAIRKVWKINLILMDHLFFSLPFFLSHALLLNIVSDMTLLHGDHPLTTASLVHFVNFTGATRRKFEFPRVFCQKTMFSMLSQCLL